MRHRAIAIVLLAATSGGVVLAPALAEAVEYAAGGSASASWAGGWPSLDLLGRASLVIADGHEIGLGVGLSTERLASRLDYAAHYERLYGGGALRPLVSLRLGGSTDLVAHLGQTCFIVGVGLGARISIAPHVAIRIEVIEELHGGDHWHHRLAVSTALEYLSAVSGGH